MTFTDHFLTRSSALKHHCIKDVRKAAKKAKAFELQKLVKKLKGLRCVPPGAADFRDLGSNRAKEGAADEVSGLEEELEIIKVGHVCSS